MSIETGLYRHYKGGIYEITAWATHSETQEIFVVYKATYQTEGENLWLRPLEMFNETIQINGRLIKRFTKI